MNLKYIKMSLTIFFALAILSVPAISKAATKYIVCGLTTGNNTGDDWTNAYQTIPVDQWNQFKTSLIPKGSLVYMGGSDSSCNRVIFSNVQGVSELDRITFKKATTDNHGTSLGWIPDYGTKTTIFNSGIAFTGSDNKWTSYITFDGVYRNTPTSGYGFKCKTSAGSDCFSTAGSSGTGYSHNLIFRYFEVTGVDSGYIQDGCMDTNPRTCGSGVNFVGARNSLLEYSYIHDVFGQAQIAGARDLTLRYNVFKRNDSTAKMHSNAISSPGSNSNIKIHGNWFEDIEGTANIAFLGGGNFDNIEVFNNVFWQNPANPGNRTGTGHGVFTTNRMMNDISGFKFYSNTIAGFTRQLRSWVYLVGGCSSNCEIKNNLWYCNGIDCNTIQAYPAVPANTILHFAPLTSAHAPTNSNPDSHLNKSFACANGSGTIKSIDNGREISTENFGAIEIINASGTFKTGDFCTDAAGGDWTITRVSSPSSIAISNNYYYGNQYRATESQIQAPTNNENPFINYSNGNFNLVNNGNSALNKGTSLSSDYATDYIGFFRPQGAGWDIGAYEYAAGNPTDTTPPSMPSGVTIN